MMIRMDGLWRCMLLESGAVLPIECLGDDGGELVGYFLLAGDVGMPVAAVVNGR